MFETTVNTAPVLDQSAIGATIIFEDAGVWGYRARQNRTGVIEAITDSRHCGHYITVAVEGFNLPKVIREDQLVAFCLVNGAA